MAFRGLLPVVIRWALPAVVLCAAIPTLMLPGSSRR